MDVPAPPGMRWRFRPLPDDEVSQVQQTFETNPVARLTGGHAQQPPRPVSQDAPNVADGDVETRDVCSSDERAASGEPSRQKNSPIGRDNSIATRCALPGDVPKAPTPVSPSTASRDLPEQPSQAIVRQPSPAGTQPSANPTQDGFVTSPSPTVADPSALEKPVEEPVEKPVKDPGEKPVEKPVGNRFLEVATRLEAVAKDNGWHMGFFFGDLKIIQRPVLESTRRGGNKWALVVEGFVPSGDLKYPDFTTRRVRVLSQFLESHEALLGLISAQVLGNNRHPARIKLCFKSKDPADFLADVLVEGAKNKPTLAEALEAHPPKVRKRDRRAPREDYGPEHAAMIAKYYPPSQRRPSSIAEEQAIEKERARKVAEIKYEDGHWPCHTSHWCGGDQVKQEKIKEEDVEDKVS